MSDVPMAPRNYAKPFAFTKEMVLFDEDYRAQLAAMEKRIKWLENKVWEARHERDSYRNALTALVRKQSNLA